MRHISLLCLLALATSTLSNEPVYSGAFDYNKAHSSRLFFATKSDAEITQHCKQNDFPTVEIWQCSHFAFEQIDAELQKKIRYLSAQLRKNDSELRSDGDDSPAALPYFERANRSWAEFRADECYSDTYSLGHASMRYMVFWDCMTRITKNRLDELNRSDADE